MAGEAEVVPEQLIELEDIVDDLGTIAQIKDLERLRAAQLPALTALVVRRGSSEDCIDLLSEALSRIADPAYRQAAGEIWGFDDRRWQRNLRERQTAAMSHLGVTSWETFRRKRSDGYSYFDRVARELGRQLLVMAPLNPPSASAEPSPGDRSAAASVESPADARRRGIPNWQVLGCLAALAALLIFVLVLVRMQQTSPSDESASPNPVAEPVEPVSCVELGLVSPSNRSVDPGAVAVLTSASLPDGLCARSPAVPIVSLLTQELQDSRGVASGAVVASSSTPVILNQSQWGSYRQVGGKSGDNAPAVAGNPVSVTNDSWGTVVRMDNGSQMVSEASDGAYFWMPAAAVSRWGETGGPTGSLGLPRSNPFFRNGDLVQDYAHGYMRLPQGTSGIQVEAIVDRRAALPDEQLLRGKIIRQTEGTAWFVDANLVRHWIQDGATWQCLGDWQNVGANDVPGYAVAALQPGPLANCEMGR